MKPLRTRDGIQPAALLRFTLRGGGSVFHFKPSNIMKTSYSIAILLVLLLAVTTRGHSAEPVPKQFASAQSSSGSDVEGKSYVAILTGEALQAAPRWTSTNDQPPLAPGAAKRAAINTLAQIVTDAQQWKLEEISLVQPFDAVFGPEYWIYKIRFSGPTYKSKSGYDMGSTLNLMILMNGEVIQPQRTDAK